MRPDTHKTHIEGATADRNAWRLIAAGLMFANLVTAVGWLMSAGDERTVVVPTEMHKTFWIEDTQASPEYLEQMALYFIRLALDITPSAVDYQSEVFLRYVDPRAYGQLKTELILEAERVKRMSASQAFFPREIEFDVRKRRVAVRGDLTTFIGEQRVRTEPQTWRITFALAGGKMSVTEFIKVDNDDPFETKKNKTGVRAAAIAEHDG